MYGRHESYEDYINHQKEKTTDPVRRKKWLGEEWELKLSGFKQFFYGYLADDYLNVGAKALCIGARTGQEVRALLDMEIEAVGIDIVPCPPLVVEGDMHNLNFEDNSFDFVFSNVYDHSLYPDKKCQEVMRVLKKGGVGVFHLQVNVSSDKYSENHIYNVKYDVLPNLQKAQIIRVERLKPNFSGMNYEVLFKKVET